MPLERDKRALRIFVDVKSSYDAVAQGVPPTGIQRVEAEIGKVLLARNHTAVVWDQNRNAYKAVTAAQFDRPATAGKYVVPDFEWIMNAPHDAADVAASDLTQLRRGLTLSLLLPNLGPWRAALIARLVVLFGRTATALPSAERRAIARRLKLSRRADRLEWFLTEARKSIAQKADPKVRVELQPGDVVFVAPFLGHTAATGEFIAMARRGIRIVQLIYDLYAIRSPWTVLQPQLGLQFGQSLALLTQVSDLVLTISEWTARDLAAWFAEQNLRSPEIVPVPLTAGLRPSSVTPAKPKDFPFAPGRFVLMTGSFSPVKNQAWAHMLWSRLHERLGDATWPLVFAGQRGGNMDETIERLQADLQYGRTLYWEQAPADAELAWLYANCGFAITPAEFEGWGLGLSEALAFGKPCLSSGRGALAEAGQGIAWERDTIDGAAWLDRCALWITQPQTLAAEAARVKRDYRPRSWEDVTNDVIAAIERHAANDSRC